MHKKKRQFFFVLFNFSTNRNNSTLNFSKKYNPSRFFLKINSSVIDQFKGFSIIIDKTIIILGIVMNLKKLPYLANKPKMI